MTTPSPQRLSRGLRLTRRYPLLSAAPESERPAIVRAALRNPMILLLVLGGGMLLLPPYLAHMFTLLGVDHEPDALLKLAKILGPALLPIGIAVPLLTKFVMPRCIRKELRKRGYDAG